MRKEKHRKHQIKTNAQFSREHDRSNETYTIKKHTFEHLFRWFCSVPSPFERNSQLFFFILSLMSDHRDSSANTQNGTGCHQLSLCYILWSIIWLLYFHWCVERGGKFYVYITVMIRLSNDRRMVHGQCLSAVGCTGPDHAEFEVSKIANRQCNRHSEL